MKAAPPKPPTFYPAGAKVIYRSARSRGALRLAGGVKRIGRGGG
jgi:hypothetical protein